jgi:hypothetical protein
MNDKKCRLCGAKMRNRLRRSKSKVYPYNAHGFVVKREFVCPECLSRDGRGRKASAPPSAYLVRIEAGHIVLFGYRQYGLCRGQELHAVVAERTSKRWRKQARFKLKATKRNDAERSDHR